MRLMYLLPIVLAVVVVVDFELALASVTVFDKYNNTLTTYDSLSAAFGPHISDDGLQGYVVVANPLNACSKIDPPPSLPSVSSSHHLTKSGGTTTTWIALIVRTPSGNCSFDFKVKNAQLAGYQAVIIYNSDSDNLIKMSSSGLIQIKIPAVFVGHTSGTELAKYYTYENGTYVILNNDDTDLNYLLIPFISVVCICFLVAVCIFVVKLALHCHKVRKNRVPRSALRKLPTKKYQKTDKYDTCPICLNEYEEGVKIRMLPCEHAYHVDCIDKWLLRNNRFCPVCKRRALPGGESSSESESESGGQQRATSTTTSQRVVNETRANEDEDTNESTRLLVRGETVGGDDGDSVLSHNASLIQSSNAHGNSNKINSNNNNNNGGDVTSLNNHMTMSMASSATNNLASSSFTTNNNNNNNNPTTMRNTASGSNLAASSSKYGSISSINNMGSVVNEAFVKEDDYEDEEKGKTTATTSPVQLINRENDEESKKSKKSKMLIDSKHTPVEYFTPRSHQGGNDDNDDDQNLFTTESYEQREEAAKSITTTTTSNKSKKKKKKSKASSTINNETVNKIASELACTNKKDNEDAAIVDERFHSVKDEHDEHDDDDQDQLNN